MPFAGGFELALMGEGPIYEKIGVVARASRATPDEDLDHPALVVANHFVAEKQFVGSTSAEAAAFGFDRKDVRALRSSSASASLQLQKHGWEQLCLALRDESVVGNVRLLCFIEFAAFDGVDLKLKSNAIVAFNQEGKSIAIDQEPGKPKVQGGEFAMVMTDSTIGPTKLLNSELTAACLLDIGGELTVIYNDILTHLQVADRTTGQALCAALRSQSGSRGDGLPEFLRKVRIAMTDAAGYNFKAERLLLSARGGGWETLHLKCDMHVVSSIHGQTFDCLGPLVSGMTAVSVSLGAFGQMTLFREAMRRVLSKQLRLVYQQPNQEAAKFRDLILDTFVGSSAKPAPLRMTVARCASGDSRKTGVFEFYAGPGDTSESVLQLLMKAFVPTVLAHAPSTWPRARWTGFDKSLLDVGLLRSTGCSRRPTRTSWRRTTLRSGRSGGRLGGGGGGAAWGQIEPRAMEKNIRKGKL